MSRFVPLSGILAVIVIVVAGAIAGESPDGDDSLREIVTFYRENDSDQVVGSALFAWGAAFFLVFVSTLWKALRAAEGDRRGASTLALVGGTIVVVGMTIFAGIGFTLGDFADDLNPVALQALNALNSDLFFPLAVGTAAFLVGAGVSVVQTGVLPKWLGWAAIVLSVLAITPAGFAAILAMGIWTLIVSVLLVLASSAPTAPS